MKYSIEGLDDVNKVTIKFFTVGGAMPAGKAVAGQADKMPAVLASISPLAIAITIAVAVLLALAIAFGGRVRARLAPAKQPPRVLDRKGGVSGKSVYVRVGLRGGSYLTKKKKKKI